MTALVRLVACVLSVAVAATMAFGQDTEPREGGIIGTGIVGTITELGSIFVNGQHIEFDAELTVKTPVGTLQASDLVPGHTVAVTARAGDENWYATDIRQILALIGPVESIDGSRLTILGTAVRAAGRIEGISVGDWVAVSGLWRNDEVVATLLQPVSGQVTLAQVHGTFLGRNADGLAVIGNTAISGIDPKHLQPGEVVRAFGTAEAAGLRAGRLEKGLFGPDVGVVQVQGYHSPPQPDGLYTVLGSGLVAYTDQPEMINSQQQIVQCGANGQLGTLGLPAPSTTEDLFRAATRLGCQISE